MDTEMERAWALAAKAKEAADAKVRAARRAHLESWSEWAADQLDRGRLAGMTPDRIVQAKADGQLDALLGITKPYTKEF